MDLQAWLERAGNSRSSLARRSGISKTTLHRITRGETVPRAKTAKAIEEATGGEVTAAELLGLDAPHSDSEAA